MDEDFLHYVWKYKVFDQSRAKTVDGQAVKVIKAGDHNRHAGPDFFNARLQLGDTTWAGNVEIHVNASDWFHHDHQHDKSYDNLVLHVVYAADEEVKRENGKSIPTLELKDLIDDQLLLNYHRLMHNKSWVACEKQIGQVPELVSNHWLERLLIERLERKSTEIEKLLELNKNNLEETFYIQLARNFGLKVNAVPFELLAKSLPNSFLGKHKNSLLQVEALLFGQSGLLDKELKDDYPNQLKKEYSFLQKKFSLKPIDSHLWKFLRLRPVNFPTIRIAQFAALIHHSSQLFSKVIHTEKLGEIEKLFKVKASEYWDTHYVFDKPSKKRGKKMGERAVHILIINTIVPFLFVYGKQKGETKFQDRAIRFLEELPAERNSIIGKFDESGLKAVNAGQSQALLELKNNYCNAKKCLNCAIGNSILKSNRA